MLNTIPLPPIQIITTPYTLHNTGAVFSDHITYDEWERFGIQTQLERNSRMWWLGDWIEFGEYRFGEKYTQAVDLTKNSEGTLRNYARTCRRWQLSRRSDKLSFSHHTVLNPYEDDVQDYWIAWCIANDASRDDLSEALNPKGNGGNEPLYKGLYARSELIDIVNALPDGDYDVRIDAL